MNSGEIHITHDIFGLTKNLLLKISIYVNQILLKAFESTKGYTK